MADNAPTALDLMRVDQVGSLLRPDSLKQAFDQRREGAITDEQLREAQDSAIREVVRKQESLKLPIITDGEFRRGNFQDSFAESVTGYAGALRSVEYKEYQHTNVQALTRRDVDHSQPGAPVVTRRAAAERLTVVRNFPFEEYRFTNRLTFKPIKVTLVGPDRISQRFDWQQSQGVYDGLDDFAHHVAELEHEMVHDLAYAGCRYIHIDEPGYTAYVDEKSIAEMRERGEDPVRNLTRSIEADNEVIGHFDGITFGIHLCRGNARSMWHREGHYDAIAEQLFNGLKAQRLLLEYDSDRAGSFAPLRFVPKGKVAVLGLITTKTPEVETVDSLKRRLDEASKYLPLEQLAISPQCGFASGIEGNLLSEDDQWRKLEVMLETASQVWGA
jgi:5-methyltetrahydropteroyltriglutamate--homocysteine methyltransferase